MLNTIRQKAILFVSALAATHIIAVTPSVAASSDNTSIATISPPMVMQKIFDTAKKNENWKTASATGKQAQIVLMSVSPQTNPNNEIGMETHQFDQVILVADGEAKAILNGQNYTVKTGDLIFIPQGTAHNFINLNQKRPLKIISFYSLNDIPPNSSYSKKSDQP